MLNWWLMPAIVANDQSTGRATRETASELQANARADSSLAVRASAIHASRNSRRALAVVCAANSSKLRPRTLARHSAVCATLAGSFRLPRSGCGRQIGAVGFDQDPIGRHRRGHGSQIVRLLERHHPGEADIHSQLDALGRRGRVAGERMHHAAPAVRAAGASRSIASTSAWLSRV